jgi:hypothetical protein
MRSLSMRPPSFYSGEGRRHRSSGKWVLLDALPRVNSTRVRAPKMGPPSCAVLRARCPYAVGVSPVATGLIGAHLHRRSGDQGPAKNSLRQPASGHDHLTNK